MNYPKLVVFDLDFTLWDCGGLWIDCTTPPFHLDIEGRVRDRSGRVFRLYPDAGEILDELESNGVELGLASRTDQPDWAGEVLELMELRNRFDYEQIYPGSKVAHFEAIRADSGIDFADMVFFDDEHRNIIEVGELGVNCIHVSRGVDRHAFQQAISE
ncbi:MAG: magnesium-dependent phosphatase-1 [Verrucomicrobiales bacterium]|nr:magnesium-dependent phosphatase-1 [Verrucomicrobiales bacterium]